MLPFCCYLLTAAAEIEKFSFPAMILSALSGTLIVFFNLKFLHKKMGRIQERLEAYGRI